MSDKSPRLQPQPKILTQSHVLEEMDLALRDNFDEKAKGRKPNEKGSKHEDRDMPVSGRDRHVAAKADALRDAAIAVRDSGKYVGNPAAAFGAKRTPNI